MRCVRLPALVAFLPLALGSCSTTHELTAAIVDGRLAFLADGNWWSRPDCFYSIDVSTDEGSPAAPEPGDDTDRVASGTYWFYWRNECANEYPVYYGQPLKGAPYRREDGSEWGHVAPKPLSPHVVYSASTLSPASSYGTAYFRLDGKENVENLTWEEAQAQATPLPASS